MRKLYYSIVLLLSFLVCNVNAQTPISRTGSVTFKLDNSKNDNKPVETAYIILDKYDLTGAGFIKEKFYVSNNIILLENLPLGKYYADIYTQGYYKKHFVKIIKVTKKGRSYAFKLEETGFYNPYTVVIPKESNDYSKSSVVFMK